MCRPAGKKHQACGLMCRQSRGSVTLQKGKFIYGKNIGCICTEHGFGWLYYKKPPKTILSANALIEHTAIGGIGGNNGKKDGGVLTIRNESL